MMILYENQNIPKELSEYMKNDKTLHKYFEMNFDGIKPKNYCGFLKIDGEEYFIVPKISNKNNDTNQNIFIYMLMYAYDINLHHEETANFQDIKHKMFEIFIKFFSDTFLKELKRGVFRKYITLEEQLKVLKGKYIYEKNFTDFYHQNIYCQYDEFSMDNELNRFFIYAIKIFKKYSSYSNLTYAESILEEVNFSHIDINRLNLKFNRTNERYLHSFDIALILLKKLIPLPSKKAQKNFVFLFDMSEVFEKFIGKIYKEIDSSAKLQHPGSFIDLKLKPDIMTQDLIIDTKYKKISKKDDLAVQDKYQMFVYGKNFKIEDTMLLYPKHLQHVKEDLKLGEDDNKVNLRMRSIDLESDKKFDEYIDEIKMRLEEMR